MNWEVDFFSFHECKDIKFPRFLKYLWLKSYSKEVTKIVVIAAEGISTYPIKIYSYSTSEAFFMYVGSKVSKTSNKIPLFMVLTPNGTEIKQ